MKNHSNSPSQASSILCVGSIAFDSVQTPAGKAEMILGGAANYFSVAASIETPVKMVGIVGADFPEDHLRWLQSRGVDVSGVEKADGKTFHWVGSYDQNLNEAKTLSTFLNVFEKFTPTISAKHRESEIVFLGNIDPSLQLHVLEQVKAPAFIACDTMNFWITGKLAELKKVLRKIDLLSINEAEAVLLTGASSLKQAARGILGMGPSALVIKRGEYGSALFSGDRIFMAPAYPVTKVSDPTGAGDTFAGGMVSALAEAKIHRDWRETRQEQWWSTLKNAVIAGTTLASFCIEDFGMNRLGKVSADEKKERQRELLEIIRVD